MDLSRMMADDKSNSVSPSASPHRQSRCFCGRDALSPEGGIYCSEACARSDAFSSLCYKPTSHSTDMRDFPPQSSTCSSASMSRVPSSASSTSADGEDWHGSHYRRLARADVRRQERQEERKRRRAYLANRSISSTCSRDVPDLIGGHSRNASTASTASSAYTIGSLSRNPSTASTASSRRTGNGLVKTVQPPTIGFGGYRPESPILEDDREEWLAHDAKPYAMRSRRRPSVSALSSGNRKRLEALRMGRPMQDALEEIIQMEKEFSLSDTEEDPEPGIFTAAFDRPPRTPPPMTVEKRSSQVPPAPGAPTRGHRVTQSFAPGPSFMQTPRRMGGHQSSLSESHTALYLATASPVASGQRSASPKLKARNSLTFTPDKAGPSIGALRPRRFDSPAGVTPKRQRGYNSPGAFHPMNGWKFPTSTTATPTRPPPIDTTNIPGNFSTPVGDGDHVISPQLLWPPSALPPPLAPALFPSSPAMNTPDFMGSSRMPPDAALPPHSGMRLGVLLGSGEDVDMDDDSTIGHGDQMAPGTGYLPVYFEHDDFASAPRWG